MEISTPSFVEKHTPLPSPEKEAEKFLGRFDHLSQKQIIEVVGIVLNEVKTSRKFHLYIGPELIEKEESFFLTAFNDLGGVNSMVKTLKFEEAKEKIGDPFFETFSEVIIKYFDYFKRNEPKYSPTSYNTHLNFLFGNLLNTAYTNQFEA